MTDLMFPVDISDPTVRIITYSTDMLERIEEIGYGEFKQENPKQKFKLLIEIRPPELKTVLRERFKVETGLENNVKSFITWDKEEAKFFPGFAKKGGDYSNRNRKKDGNGGLKSNGPKEAQKRKGKLRKIKYKERNTKG